MALVAYYKLDGNGVDSTGNGHDGTVPANVSFVNDRFGNPSAALFNGNNSDHPNGDIQIADHVDFQGTAYTYCAWVRSDRTQTPSFNRVSCVLSRHSSALSRYGFMMYGYELAAGDDRIRLGVYYKAAEGYDTTQAVSVNGKNTWHHLAIAYDDSTNKGWLWIDGVNYYSGAAIQCNVGKYDICIGQSPDTNGSPSYWNKWLGAIDDVRIYNTILSDNDILALVGFTPRRPKIMQFIGA